MDFVLASRNRKKISELEAILRTFSSERGKFRLLSLDDIGIKEDIVEDGATFEENAVIKASVPASKGYWGISDDSGLCVDALGGAPGVWSARFAASNGYDKGFGADANNNALLLEKLAGLPPEKRGAKFVCVIAVCPPLGKADAVTVRGECPGIILDRPRGVGGFGYDPLFLYEPKGKTFAELDAIEKNEISHRARALKALAELKIIK
jgi:non-canonical purine NTP pyrophosphatase, rdgB/HAM1 family